MGQFLDSAVFAGTSAATNGKKPTVPTTGSGTSPVTTSALASVFAIGGTRESIDFHINEKVLLVDDSSKD